MGTGASEFSGVCRGGFCLQDRHHSRGDDCSARLLVRGDTLHRLRPAARRRRRRPGRSCRRPTWDVAATMDFPAVGTAGTRCLLRPARRPRDDPRSGRPRDGGRRDLYGPGEADGVFVGETDTQGSYSASLTTNADGGTRMLWAYLPLYRFEPDRVQVQGSCSVRRRWTSSPSRAFTRCRRRGIAADGEAHEVTRGGATCHLVLVFSTTQTCDKPEAPQRCVLERLQAGPQQRAAKPRPAGDDVVVGAEDDVPSNQRAAAGRRTGAPGRGGCRHARAAPAGRASGAAGS